MESGGYKRDAVLISGDEKLAQSVSVCLLKGGHPVTLFTENKKKALKGIQTHFEDLLRFTGGSYMPDNLEITSVLDDRLHYQMAIAITREDLPQKKTVISRLEKKLPADAIIAVNTENIPLGILQEDCVNPGRIIGLNWVEPAHTTFFLEIITNPLSNGDMALRLSELAKKQWGKDPYTVSHGLGIRAKMLAALFREAAYLVQNDYASVEDIDRACRNDAGSYLPFAGNFRYMDLMGTYAYGLVMKDLNRELSKDRNLPEFLTTILANGGLGMENGKGFYLYPDNEAEKWNETFREFSYRIQQIINKYPFRISKDKSRLEIKSNPIINE